MSIAISFNASKILALTFLAFALVNCAKIKVTGYGYATYAPNCSEGRIQWLWKLASEAAIADRTAEWENYECDPGEMKAGFAVEAPVKGPCIDHKTTDPLFECTGTMTRTLRCSVDPGDGSKDSKIEATESYMVPVPASGSCLSVLENNLRSNLDKKMVGSCNGKPTRIVSDVFVEGKSEEKFDPRLGDFGYMTATALGEGQCVDKKLAQAYIDSK